MHKHKLKLRQVGTWYYNWHCDCGFRYAVPKAYFRLLMLGKIR